MCMHEWPHYVLWKKQEKPERVDVWREQSSKWFEASICQRERGEEMGRDTDREREGGRERERQGGIDKLKTACGCTDTGCETDKKKGDRGGSDRAQRQEEGVKDSQPERVTECSPERESVWVNVRAALANASVNLNL